MEEFCSHKHTYPVAVGMNSCRLSSFLFMAN